MRKALKNIAHNRTVILIYSMLFVLLLVTSFMAIRDTNKIGQGYDLIIDSSIYKIRLMRENRLAAEQVQSFTIDKVFHPSLLIDGGNDELKKNILKIDSNLKKFSKHVSTKEEDSLFQKTYETWQQYQHSRKKFIELANEEQKAINYYETEEKKAYRVFYSSTNFLSNSVYENIKEEDAMLDQFTTRSQLKASSLIGLIIIFLIVLGFMVVRNVKKIEGQHASLIKKEKEIQESEHIYKNLFDKSPLPKWVCDRTTLQVYEVNEAAMKLYGYSRDEFLKLTVFDIRPKEDHEKLRRYIKKNDFMSRNEGIRKHVRKTGEIIWVEISIDTISYKEKEALLVVIHDVTEKLKVQEKLKQEEEFYRSITENSSDIQLVTNEKGIITFASQSIFNVFGFAKNEIIGRTSKDFWHPDDFKKNKKKIYKLAESPGESIQFEIRCLDKNKCYRWCEARISNQLHNPGINGFISNYTEITERKWAEEKIKTSEELYHSLFDKNPLPIFLVDKKGLQFLEVNDTALELYGYSREEFLKMSVFDLRCKEDHEPLRTIMGEGKTDNYKNYEVKHIKKNGEKMIVDVTIENIHYKGQIVHLGIIKDITRTVQLQKQLNEEKENKRKEITRAIIDGQEKQKTELGKELHDNVNQILACAKLYLSSAHTAEIPKKNELIEESKGLIDSGIQEIRKLSKSLVAPALTKSTLKESIEELVDPIRITTDKKIVTNFSMPDESILCDKIKLTIYRIIQEQMNNILKYAEASRVQIELKQDIYKLLLQVKDNGKGFDVKAKRKGIGLTNIANRAEVYNGKVVIDSAPGNGCALSVFFPLENLRHSGDGIIAMTSPGMAS